MCRKSFLEEIGKSKENREESKGDSSSEQEGDNDVVYNDQNRSNVGNLANQRQQLREIIDVVQNLQRGINSLRQEAEYGNIRMRPNVSDRLERLVRLSQRHDLGHHDRRGNNRQHHTLRARDRARGMGASNSSSDILPGGGGQIARPSPQPDPELEMAIIAS